MAKSPDKKIAICIPTYNREKELARLLNGLAIQENLPTNYQFTILIVDNNVISYFQSVVGKLLHFPFKVQGIHVRQRGLVCVRNAAVSWVLNNGMDALIFVDDDEVVPPRWLMNMVISWEKYNADIITGPVDQLLPSQVSRFITKYHLLDSHFNPPSGTKIEYANSNNTLVSKKVLQKMGPSFHPDLNFSGGEDTLFFHQCYLNGFDIVWENSVRIYEPTALTRSTVRYVLTRWFNIGMSSVLREKILFPKKWLKLLIEKLATGLVNVARGLAAFLIKKNKVRFGQSMCRFFWVLGICYGLFGFAARNKQYK